MKRMSALVIGLCVLGLSTVTWSQETQPAPAPKKANKVLGGYFSVGITTMSGDGWVETSDPLGFIDEQGDYVPSGVDRDDRTAKFSMGGLVYFDYFFTDIIGVEAGVGFLTKGARYTFDEDSTHSFRVIYMEVPVSLKLDIQQFQVGLGLALFVGLSGKTKTEEGNESATYKWGNDAWDWVYRANLGPRINVGYAIPVGPVSIVPSATWMIHLINDLDNDQINSDLILDFNEYRPMRAMNMMFNVGVEWGF